MGYSNNYSSVYFAKSLYEDYLIKIGETNNPLRRADQLIREGIDITLTYDIKGGKPERRLIEDYLRIKILRTGRTRQYKEDYFYCNSLETVKYLENSFDQWVKEALQLMNNIQHENYGLYGKIPIQPQYSEWLWEICRDLETTTSYQTHFQCSYEREEELLKMFSATFAPFYQCTIQRKCTWIYLTIK
jgi:hypothetical protein